MFFVCFVCNENSQFSCFKNFINTMRGKKSISLGKNYFIQKFVIYKALPRLTRFIFKSINILAAKTMFFMITVIILMNKMCIGIYDGTHTDRTVFDVALS
jgi:hypothetical protein